MSRAAPGDERCTGEAGTDISHQATSHKLPLASSVPTETTKGRQSLRVFPTSSNLRSSKAARTHQQGPERKL